MDGYRAIKINTQERAISPDINRLQTFMHQDLAELFRQLISVQTDDDDPGALVAPTTLGTPLVGEVISGLMVKPVAGTLDLTVDAGILMALQPDAAPDESNYKYIRDAGIPAAGTLAITANASGAIRIDVIECRVHATALTVTDSRDVYNTATGLFAAATVTKETKGQIEYRVRAGVGGSGLPANASGWLPLCVASVPNGVVSNNTITFWDVRPLVSDRSRLVNAIGDPEYLTGDGRIERVDASNVLASGIYTARVAGRLVGGKLRRGTPGTDAETINLTESANWGDGGTYSEPQTTSRHVYLLFPGGLPRWARYTDGPSGRLPRAPKGIPVLSNVTPTQSGVPSAAITLPTSTGLVTSTSVGICILTTLPTGGNAYLSANVTNKSQMYATTSGFVELAGTYAAGIANFDFTNALWPRNAKAALVNVSMEITVATVVLVEFFPSLDLYYAATATGASIGVQLPVFALANPTAGSLNINWQSGLVRLPRPRTYPGTDIPSPWRAVLNLITGLTFTIGPKITVLGYEF